MMERLKENQEEIGDNNYRNIIIIFIASILLTILVMSIIASPENLMNPLKGHPWNKSNLNIYIDIIGIPVEEVDEYTNNALLAFRWWESEEGLKRLGYQVNFTRVYNLEHANVNIIWTEKLETQGHTYINTTEDSGEPTCDAFNPSFTLCNITIKVGLSGNEMQQTIKHEIGHALGLKHSFNTKDFMVFCVALLSNSNNLNSPTDIMFAPDVVKATIYIWLIIIVIVIVIFQRITKWLRLRNTKP